MNTNYYSQFLTDQSEVECNTEFICTSVNLSPDTFWQPLSAVSHLVFATLCMQFEEMDQKLDFDLQRCISAFKQGNYDDAVQFLPQLQQPAVLQVATTEFKTPINDAPSKNVSLLHLAAYHGWIEIISTLIPSAPLTLYEDSHCQTYLHYAALGGMFEMLVYLIKNEICHPKTTLEGMSLLYCACCGGNMDIIRYIMIRKQLFKPRAHVKKIYCDYLPLHLACLSGHLNVVKYFISVQKCNHTTMSRSPNGDTPLHCASIGSHLHIIDYLITVKKCDPMIRNVNGVLPLHYACRKGHLDVVKYFIANQKCNLTSRDEVGNTSLHHAWLGHHMNIIHYLCSVRECNPLQFACICGSLNVTKHFINEKICNPKCQDQDGKTLLHYASQGGDMDIIRFLITEEHCDSKTTNISGELPLHITCLHGHLNVVKYFITEQHCSPKSQTIDGDTPLHYASKGGHEDIVKNLTTWQNCSHETLNCDGLLPVHIACLNGHLNVVKFFQRFTRAGRNQGPPINDTLLHYACKGGHENIIKYLLTEGQHYNQMLSNSKGLLPVQIACLTGHLNVVKFYISKQNFGRTSLDSNSDMLLLHYASEGGHVDVIEYLLTQQHCDPMSTNSKGILPVHVACRHGHLNLVKYFVTKVSCDPTDKANNGKTLLHYASEGGHLNIIEYLVEEKNCDPMTADNEGILPLHLACLKGELKIVKYFIMSNHKCDPSSQDQNGWTTLHYTSMGGHIDIIKYLIADHGDMCDTKTLNESLQLACVNGHFKVFKYFINEKGCDPKCQDQEGKTLLHYASQGGDVNISIFLIKEEHCDSKTPNIRGILPLHIACLYGHLNLVKYFINKQYCSPTCQTIDGDTPLHYASKGGHEDIVEYLTTWQHCHPSISNKKGLLPLHIACIHGHLNVVKFYCSIWRFKTTKGANGNTLLHYASEGGHVDIIKYLLIQQRYDPKSTNNMGILPLHIACIHGHLNVVKFYCSIWRFERTQGPNGNTLLHYASEGGHVDIIKYLLTQQHYDPKSTNKMGILPTHVACLHGHLNVVKYFVTKLSCDLTIQDNDGKTLLHYASEGGHLNIIEYLVEETQCDPMTADNKGILSPHFACNSTMLNDSFHLACANGHLNVVKYFINRKFLDSSKVLDKDGRTVLHTACHFRRTHIVEWLLHEGRVDVMAKDNKRRTCIDLATNCYPLLKLFKPLVDSKKSFPIHSYNKVVLTGNSGAGKTTLAKVISERAILKTYLYHWITGTLFDQVELHTAGIIPSYINSREVGNIVLYDLAGHAEYHSSHSAIMERVMQQSPATFITVIDFSNKITEIKQQLHYWLNFIDCITRKTSVGSCTLMVVGSHADLCSKEEIQVKSTLVKECLQQGQVQRQQFIDIVTIDCRNIMAIDQFIKQLNNCQQIIADRTSSMSYYCHLLYAFLKIKKWTVCSFHDIFSIFSKEDLSITPDQLTEHLDTLSDRGMIIFLKNQQYLDKSWIVVDTEALLEKIGILFAPKKFKEYHPDISIGPGIICSSNLKNLFDDYHLNMLVGFLEILELCYCVTNTCEATVNLRSIENFSSLDLANIYLFIPSLLDNDRPTISSNNDEGFSFGWCLCCKDKEYYSFGSRFLHVLLLRLAYTFKLHHKHREYIVWMNGISWDNKEGYRIVVELVDHKRCVMVVMSHMTRSRKVKLIKCRSKVIRLILDLQQEFCPHMETAEYLISPSKLQKWPEDDVCFPDNGDLLSIVNTAESMLKKSPYILSLKGISEECNSTEQVLLDEPYNLLRTSTVCDLMDNSKKNKLISSPSVLREVNIACQLNQSDLSPICHLCLRECVDRLSIFAGRDPIVSAEQIFL